MLSVGAGSGHIFASDLGLFPKLFAFYGRYAVLYDDLLFLGLVFMVITGILRRALSTTVENIGSFEPGVP